MESSVTFIWIDYVIFAVIGLSAIIGLFRGFVREALSLVAWGAAIWVALTYTELFADYLEPYLKPYTEQPSLHSIAAFALLFLGTLTIGGILNYLVSLLVRKSGIGGTDRFLGVFFGIARGGLVVAILVLLAGLTSLPQDPWWSKSRTLPYFEELAESLSNFLPEDIAKDFVFDPSKIISNAIGGAATGPSAPAPSAPPSVDTAGDTANTPAAAASSPKQP